MNWGRRGGITETRNWLDWSAWERMPEGREERRGDLRTVRERGALEFMEKRGKWGEKKDFGKRYEYKGFRKFCCVLCYMSPCFPGGSEVKASAWNAESQVQSLGREDSLEKEMATHSSTLAWRIPWREEPGRLQSMGSLRVGRDWATSLSCYMIPLLLLS